MLSDEYTFHLPMCSYKGYYRYNSLDRLPPFDYFEAILDEVF